MFKREQIRMSVGGMEKEEEKEEEEEDKEEEVRTGEEQGYRYINHQVSEMGCEESNAFQFLVTEQLVQCRRNGRIHTLNGERGRTKQNFLISVSH